MESLVGLNDELNASLRDALSEIMELRLSQCKAEVRDWYLVSVHRVVKVRASVILSYPVAHHLVSIETVILPKS